MRNYSSAEPPGEYRHENRSNNNILTAFNHFLKHLLETFLICTFLNKMSFKPARIKVGHISLITQSVKSYQG